MRLSMIVAHNNSNVIGVNNSLPWRIKEDLQNFKRITDGHFILMGRKTFESLGKPLPGRVHLVISRNPQPPTESVIWFSSIFKAIRYAKKRNETELFIIGGEQIFKHTLHIVDRVYLSKVEAPDVKGDAFFPQMYSKHWNERHLKFYFKPDLGDLSFKFSIFSKK